MRVQLLLTHQTQRNYLQFLNVWDSEVHQVLLLAFQVMAIVELGGGWVHLVLAGEVLWV